MSIWKEEFVKLEEKYNAMLLDFDKTKKNLKAWKRKAEILKNECRKISRLKTAANLYNNLFINDQKKITQLMETVEKQHEEICWDLHRVGSRRRTCRVDCDRR